MNAHETDANPHRSIRWHSGAVSLSTERSTYTGHRWPHRFVQPLGESSQFVVRRLNIRGAHLCDETAMLSCLQSDIQSAVRNSCDALNCAGGELQQWNGTFSPSFVSQCGWGQPSDPRISSGRGNTAVWSTCERCRQSESRKELSGNTRRGSISVDRSVHNESQLL